MLRVIKIIIIIIIVIIIIIIIIIIIVPCNLRYFFLVMIRAVNYMQ
jgi:hypothetical protein